MQFKGKHECGRCERGEREAGERIHDWNLVEQGLTEEEARQEASRCLRCDHFGFGAFRGGRNLGMVEPNKTTVSDNTESGALNMVKLTIDNCEVVVPEHTTILDAAKSVGIQIPTLCYLRNLNEIGGCRVCVVEVEGCDQLVAACNNYVLDGMVVHTNSPKAREAVAPTCSCCCPSTTRAVRAACAVVTATCDHRQRPGHLLSAVSKALAGEGWDFDFPIIRENDKCIKCWRCIKVWRERTGPRVGT